MNQQQLKILKDNFGYSTLRPAQEPVIQSILSNHDTLAIMPTGGGKSLCYQLPALLTEGLTVVISPLIALMHDQVESLKESGVWAEYLNSSQEDTTKDMVMNAIRTQQKDSYEEEKLKLLYISPEKLFANDGFILNFLKHININLFAIDEAHCISSWGHDFRPEYSNLGELKVQFPNIPLIALTATADELTRQDILQRLKLNDPNVYISSFDRPNITYTVVDKSNGYQQLFNYITAHKDHSGIIYCLSRKSTEEVAQKLLKNNIKAGVYHAKLSKEEKDKTYSDFMKDKIQVVVATIAFGMGIDKPNVRFVIHWNLPKSIENYYQETGRAGRDGLPSEALLLYNIGDVFTLKKFIDSGNEDNPYIPAKDVENFRRMQHDKLSRLIEFCKTGHCRRRVLLQYFNEKLEADCGNCDACLSPKQKTDGTIIAQKIISSIAKTGQLYGITYIISHLLGELDERALRLNHNQLSTFGIGKDSKKEEWAFYINQLVDLGLVNFKYDGYIKTIALDPTAIEFIKSNSQLELVQYVENKVQKPIRTKIATNVELSELQNKLLEKLKNLRRTLAEEDNVPPYIIFGDASLVEMVLTLPLNYIDFGKITGVGKIKQDKFGPTFTRAITDFCDEYTDLTPTQTLTDRVIKEKPTKSNTLDETKNLFLKHKSVIEVAKIRKYSKSTILSHIVTLYQNNELTDEDIKPIQNQELYNLIKIEKEKGINYTLLTQWVNHIEKEFGIRYDYDDIRICIC